MCPPSQTGLWSTGINFDSDSSSEFYDYYSKSFHSILRLWHHVLPFYFLWFWPFIWYIAVRIHIRKILIYYSLNKILDSNGQVPSSVKRTTPAKTHSVLLLKLLLHREPYDYSDFKSVLITRTLHLYIAFLVSIPTYVFRLPLFLSTRFWATRRVLGILYVWGYCLGHTQTPRQ